MHHYERANLLRPLANLRTELKCRSQSVGIPANIATSLAYSDSSLLIDETLPKAVRDPHAVVTPDRENATRQAILVSEALSLSRMECCYRP